MVPDKEVGVPVTVGLPVIGTRSCANQDMKSMNITRNIRVGECSIKKKLKFEIVD